MQKNLIHGVIGLVMLLVSAIPSNAQWVKTNWTAGSGYLMFIASQNNVLVKTWDAFNGGRLFLTADNGANWRLIGSADSSLDFLSIVMLNDTLLAGSWRGFYRSAAIGASWNSVTPAGMPDSAVWSVALLGANLLAGCRGAVYTSADSGATWTGIKSGIPATARITAFAASGGAIFAGSDSNGVFLMSGDGSGWTEINSGLTDKHISQLAIVGKRLFAVTLKGVFVSVNKGAVWTANTSSLKKINCLAVVQGQLFAGTDTGGVYRSADSGATWSIFGSGVPAGARVMSLAAGNDVLFAGTDSCVWRIPLFPTVTTTSGSAFLACSGLRVRMHGGLRATVDFTLSSPEMVDILLYDFRGAGVRTPVHQMLCAGRHSVTVSTAPIAAGSYIVRLRAGAAVHQQVFSLY